MTAAPFTVHDSTVDDGYAKGDDVDPAREPGNGALVLALYRGYHGHPDYEKVWRREDLSPGQTDGNWFEIRTASALCTHCGTTRQLGQTGPDSAVLLAEFVRAEAELDRARTALTGYIREHQVTMVSPWDEADR